MIHFVRENMAPLMFGGMILFMLVGYPAAFSLAATGLFFGFIGIELGLISPDFLGNLTYPVTLVNNFLQGKLHDGMTDAARLLVNSTIGIGGRECSFRRRKVLVHINAVALERREQVVNFFRGVHLGRQDIVHLIVEQVSPLLAHGDELPYLIVFFLKSQRHALSPMNLIGPTV